MMVKIDEVLVYVAHGAFWTSFAVARMVARNGSRAEDTGGGTVHEPISARGAGGLVALHAAAFALLYLGIASGVFGRMPLLFPELPYFGAMLIAAGAAVSTWGLLHFSSWRFKAGLAVGHKLATSGPFAYVRHPLYLALSLLAVGSVVWIPNFLTGAGALLVVWIGDLRGRSEEKLLEIAFQGEYRDYKTKVARFIPGVY